MPDYNIIVKNMLGGGSGAKTRLSARKSSKRNKNTMQLSKNINSKSNNGAMLSGSGINLPSSSTMGKLFKTAAMTAAAIKLADKGAKFAIHLQEANTGEQLRAGNTKNSLDIVTSLGTNLMMGAVQNELFTKKVISRQNFGLDYGREIYSINVEGSKYKRI